MTTDITAPYRGTIARASLARARQSLDHACALADILWAAVEADHDLKQNPVVMEAIETSAALIQELVSDVGVCLEAVHGHAR